MEAASTRPVDDTSQPSCSGISTKTAERGDDIPSEVEDENNSSGEDIDNQPEHPNEAASEPNLKSRSDITLRCDNSSFDGIKQSCTITSDAKRTNLVDTNDISARRRNFSGEISNNPSKIDCDVAGAMTEKTGSIGGRNRSNDLMI